MKKVTVIPSTINPLTQLPLDQVVKRRVAAYARVSTDSDEQLTSYDAQIDYYSKYIQRNPEWSFVDVYSDEGISGTNIKNRPGFKQMMEDALSGKIDLIVTKSISRFARNTVDTLVTVRKLKDKGVECYFEKENIYTFDSKGELILTIMSSIAQEESRSLSQNVTWGKRKAFADGRVSFSYRSFLGYQKGPNGEPEIVPEEAEIIRKIYKMFLSGYAITQIKETLDAKAKDTPMGTKKWAVPTIKNILQNEKYKGDALLQKTFTVDFLQKKSKRNEGEVPQYYVENSHPAIIDPHEWDLVQEELKRRAELGKQFKGSRVFASRLICSDCGAFYGPKVWHSNTKYRSEIWQCNHKFKNRKKGIECTTPHLVEEQLKQKFIEAFNKLGLQKSNVIKNCKAIIAMLDNIDELNTQIAAQTTEVDIIANMAKSMISENASIAQDQTSYQDRYARLKERYETELEILNQLIAERERKQAQKKSINLFMRAYTKLPKIITEWSERTWNNVVDHVVISNDGGMKFRFKSGIEVSV